MEITFELVTYNEELNSFEQDNNSYKIELNNEDTETYNLLKDSDMSLYNWLQKLESFLEYIKENVYQNSIGKKFAISDIDGSSFIRFYFFKSTSGDSHYEYFTKLFNIHVETEWQDREDVGELILEYLAIKQKELIIELS